MSVFERFLAKIMPADLVVGSIALRHLPFLFFAYACLLPRELTIEVMDAAFIPYRLAAIVFAPFAIALISREPLRPSLVDVLIIFAASWVPYSLYTTSSLQAGLVTGGSYALDLALAYLLGRAAIRTPQDLRTIFLCLFPGLIVLVAIFAMESLSNRMILRPTLASLLGTPQPIYYHNVRFGLLRAMGPFPHPILGGVFLAGLLPLAWYFTHNLSQRLIALGIAAGAIFTVSSAAIISIGIGFALIVMDIVQRLSRLPIFLLAGFYGLAMMLGAVIFAKDGIIPFLVRNLTFDPANGFYRMMIWEYGGAEAMQNPVFGIGQREWTRPAGMPSDTVDSFWLLLSMFYGLPAMAFALLAMLGTIVGLLMTQRFRHEADRGVAKAIIFFLIIIIFSGLTVHFWENLNAWIFGVVGAGVSLATQARIAPAPVVAMERPGRFDWVTRLFRRPGLA